MIKENDNQPHTYSTQSETSVSQRLEGVRKAAKENKETKFTALLHHMTVDLLRESFYGLKRKAAAGVDGVTGQDYEAGLEDRLVALHGRVHRGACRAQPSRRVFIPKSDGRQRPLGIVALEDRFETCRKMSANGGCYANWPWAMASISSASKKFDDDIPKESGY